MDIKLRFVNQSRDGNRSEVVMYQKNQLTSMASLAIAWKVIRFCGRDCYHPFVFPAGFEVAVEKMLDFAGKRVRAGLMTPTLGLSFGGELDVMRALPGYQRLRDTCAEYNVEVYESVMGLSGMVNVGKGALVVGFAAENAPFS